MKKIFCVVLILVLCLSSFALADTDIRVPGSGVVFASADVATISLGVNASHADVKTAQSTVNAALAAIRQVLLENGVAKDAISTSSISLYSLWNENESGEVVYTYTASTNLSIRTTDLESVGKLIDLAFDAGANSLNTVNFGLQDPSAAQEKALRLAVEDARKQAEIIADACKLTITGIDEISESPSYNYTTGISNYSKMEARAADGAGETIVQPEQIRIEASVEIIFQAE